MFKIFSAYNLHKRQFCRVGRMSKGHFVHAGGPWYVSSICPGCLTDTGGNPRSEPDCNCCLSNKYTYMQLRSPEVTRVNFHLSYLGARVRDSNNLIDSPRWANHQDLNHTEEYETLFF